MINAKILVKKKKKLGFNGINLNTRCSNIRLYTIATNSEISIVKLKTYRLRVAIFVFFDSSVLVGKRIDYGISVVLKMSEGKFRKQK